MKTSRPHGGAGPDGDAAWMPKPAPAENSLLIDTDAAAELLAMSARTLFELRKSGAIPYRKIGGMVRFYRPELEKWIEAGCPAVADITDRIR